MANPIKIETKGNELIVTIDVSKGAWDEAPLSKEGKRKLVASTRGNLAVATPSGQAQLQLNLMRTV